MRFNIFIILIPFLFIFSSCGKKSHDINVPEPKFKMESFKTDISNFSAVAWEKGNSKRKEWSKMVYSVIENEEPTILDLNAAKDIESFCANYKNLDTPQRLNFWGQFFAAVTQKESGWNPLSQMTETSFKYVDSVTRQPVKSEGLLQLSYQDEDSYKLDCGFNWTIDSQIEVTDPRRSILNPYLNLRCGIKIFSIQLKKYHAIQVDRKKIYWNVLRFDEKTRSDSQSAKEIKKMTQSFKICQKN